MKNNKKVNWQSLETAMLNGIGNEQNQVSLKDTPFYPLAFHTEMPENVGFDNGHVSFRFHDFNINGLDTLELNTELCKTDKNKLHIALRWKDISLKAKYEVKATYASRINLDTGGNMQELDESFAKAAGAETNNGVAPLSPDEIDTMVTQARAQKDPINGTYHGPTLMASYYKNNESYNTVFCTSARLRALWSNGGVTTQMSRDTSSALSASAPINNNTYSNGQDYNHNSFQQQVNVSIALYVLANASTKGSPQYQQYMTAAGDSSNFSSTIQTNLGNNSADIPTMTGTDVYNTLNDKTKTPQVTNMREFINGMDQANGDASTSAGADEEATKNGWKILSEQERRDIRERIFLFREELMADKSTHFDMLWSGDCHTELKGAEATMTLTYNDEKADWKITESNLKFPAFAVEVDDSMWTGKIADVVRERLASMHFVKSLLQSKIQSSIQKVTEKVMLHTLTTPGIVQ